VLVPVSVASSDTLGDGFADLSDKMGLFEDIRFLKIACAGGGRTAQNDAQGDSASSGSTSKK